MRKQLAMGATFIFFVGLCLYLAVTGFHDVTTSQKITAQLYNATKQAALTMGSTLENANYSSDRSHKQALIAGQNKLISTLKHDGIHFFHLDQFLVLGYSKVLNRIDLQAKITYAVPGFAGLITNSASAMVSDAVDRRSPPHHEEVVM